MAHGNDQHYIILAYPIYEYLNPSRNSEAHLVHLEEISKRIFDLNDLVNSNLLLENPIAFSLLNRRKFLPIKIISIII